MKSLLLAAFVGLVGAQTFANAQTCAGLPNGATMAQLKTCLLANYDRTERPTAALQLESSAGSNLSCAVRAAIITPPDQVRTQFYIDKLAVDQKTLTYTLYGYFRAWWTDGRLAYDGSCGVPQLKFSSAAQLWVPDFYFEKPQSVTLGGGSRGELLSVQPDGSIFWSRQAEVSLSCPMHFGNLPFDTHECPYKLGLYSQLGSEVVLQWHNNSAMNAEALANWEAPSSSTAVWSLLSVTHANEAFAYTSGTYTYATASLRLGRIDQSYVVSYLVLASLFVLMTYAGFWISPAAAPGRIALGVISVLVLNNLSNSAKASLPPFSYNTWLTDFLFISMLFNLMAFFSYAAVNFGMTIDAKMAAAKKKRQDAQAAAGETGIQLNDETRGRSITLLPGLPDAGCSPLVTVAVRALKNLDHTMRWLFLVLYLLFIIIMVAVKGTYNEDS